MTFYNLHKLASYPGMWYFVVYSHLRNIGDMVYSMLGFISRSTLFFSIHIGSYQINFILIFKINRLIFAIIFYCDINYYWKDLCCQTPFCCLIFSDFFYLAQLRFFATNLLFLFIVGKRYKDLFSDYMLNKLLIFDFSLTLVLDIPARLMIVPYLSFQD